MALKGMEVSLIMVLVTMICVGANAQSKCSFTELFGLAPCLSFITARSSTPSFFCCSGLANVVQSNPQCLCSLLNGGGGAKLGITINQTLALELPGACNVQTPPVSTCNGANRPTSSPSPSPVTSHEVDSPASSPSANRPASSPSPVTSQVDSPASSPSVNQPTSSPSPVTSQVDSPASSPVDDYDENPYSPSPTTPSVDNVPAGSESKPVPSTDKNASTNAGSESKPVPSTDKNASTNAGSAPKPRKIKSSGNTIAHPLPLSVFLLIIMSGALIINNF